MTIAEKLTTIAENEQKVFDAGKQAEYDAFWNAYQNNGARTDYKYAFYGKQWNNTTFKPKYHFTVSDSNSMFYMSDIYGRFEGDFSACGGMINTFHSANFSELGVIDLRNCKQNNLINTFHNMPQLVKIDKIIITENLNFGGGNTFAASSNLESITIEGTIGQNGLILSGQAKLNKASIKSIIAALSPNTSGLTVTLSRTAVDNAYYDTPSSTLGGATQEWAIDVAFRSNWTISLV